MTFNIGGALGDSTWLNEGEMPIVSLQGQADFFAPFTFGMVTVPGTGGNVVEVSGASDVIRIANAYGNNDIFKTPTISDAYTTRADAFNTAYDGTYGNAGDEGLFAFEGAANGNGPWEWLDTVAAKTEATAYGQDADAVIGGFYASNPVFEFLYKNNGSNGYAFARGRAIAYCDTIQGYLSPRLYRGLIEQPFSVEEISISKVAVYPNPTSDRVTFVSENNNPISAIDFYSMEGKIVRRESAINASTFVIANLDLPKGIYFATVHFTVGSTTKKVVIK